MRNIFRGMSLALMIGVSAGLPALAQDALASVPGDFAAVHAACLKYLSGDANAVPALQNAGFEVKQRGKRITAIKRGPNSIPMNRRPEVSIITGKSIPINAKATCQISVSRIGKPLAEQLNLTSMVKVAQLGFVPVQNNGITIAKYARGDEIWAIDASFQEQISALDQTVSKMK